VQDEENGGPVEGGADADVALVGQSGSRGLYGNKPRLYMKNGQERSYHTCSIPGGCRLSWYSKTDCTDHVYRNSCISKSSFFYTYIIFISNSRTVQYIYIYIYIYNCLNNPDTHTIVKRLFYVSDKGAQKVRKAAGLICDVCGYASKWVHARVQHQRSGQSGQGGSGLCELVRERLQEVCLTYFTDIFSSGTINIC
jgi:hypothetical protein